MIRAFETQTAPKLAMKHTMAICSRRSAYSVFATTLVFVGVTAAFLTFGGYDSPFSPGKRLVPV